MGLEGWHPRVKLTQPGQYMGRYNNDKAGLAVPNLRYP